MNGKDYLADTTILIKLFDGNNDVVNLLEGQNIFISFITEMELLSKPGLTRTQIIKIKETLNDLFLINLNDDIKNSAIVLRRNYRLKLPDAIIAATALYLNIPLITLDKEFNTLKDIDVITLDI